ncbi:MAG: methyltransferase domain-containing protein [Acidobacteria bacterium]|nr:methyltransferase domain-containing protein [Acidobacteriota bacterium]
MSKNHHRMLLLAALWLGCVAAAAAFQLASRDTKDWIETLERPERIKSQKIDEVLAVLNLKPGMVVADLGAGSGIFARPMAKAVGPKGKVYAVDIDKGLLDYINERAKKENVNNIVTVLGEYSDPKIPKKDVDLAFFNDVLHHIENRATYLKALARYIKPTGQVVIVEMDKNDPNTPHKDKPELLLSRQQIDQWMADAGFKPVKENTELFPGTKHFVFYGRK